VTDHSPFVIRILAEVARLVGWTTRGFLAAAGADPAAFLALGILCFAAVVLLLTVPMAARSVVLVQRWIGRHVAAHHQRANADAVNEAFYEIADRFKYDTADDPMEQLGGVVRIHPQPVPPRRELHRRPRRFPGRRLTRRSTTSSSFDRGHHS
jgi:hypothetical protein